MDRCPAEWTIRLQAPLPPLPGMLILIVYFEIQAPF
jgi:hypothetical protein